VSEALNPYSPPKAPLEVAEAVRPPIELASRAARLGAAVLDTIVIVSAGAFGATIHPAAIFIAVAAIGGVNLWTLHRRRASIGKLAFGLRIVRSDGADVELWRIVFLRWLPVFLAGATRYLGILAVFDALFIFGRARRCVHDYLANTVVVDAK
jgi:uncharacterized RDD family membrane protein YckC